MIAAELGDIEWAREELGKGTDVNAKDKYGQTSSVLASTCMLEAPRGGRMNRSLSL